MKRIILLSIVLITCLNIHAQGNDHETGDWNNYCIQNDGNKISVIYQSIAITADVTLDNGTIIKTDGTIITKDGKTTLLRAGQCINRDGTISPSPSGNREKQNSDKKQR
ncbi:MAG TPA: DUF6799 domain-containing protein [Bacteroidia bacterium]|nr:DUF6799 domain-containing protein [Bacteroidia bacterium]